MRMGTGDHVRGDNNKLWIGVVKKILPDSNEYKVAPDDTPGSNGRAVPAWSVKKGTSGSDLVKPLSRGKVSVESLKREPGRDWISPPLPHTAKRRYSAHAPLRA